MTKKSIDLNKTVYTPLNEIQTTRKWHVIDASTESLGRIATTTANLLIWKWKSMYCDFWDCGDHVVIINADKIKVTWNKLADKMYYTYSWYKGNVRSKTMKDIMSTNPMFIMQYAVKGMLPKNKLREKRMKRLHVYKDAIHPFNLDLNKKD